MNPVKCFEKQDTLKKQIQLEDVYGTWKNKEKFCVYLFIRICD